MPKEKIYKINIPTDPMNKDKEQYKVYQLDGETLQVPIGRFVEVPKWVAETAKEVGDIDDYLEI